MNNTFFHENICRKLKLIYKFIIGISLSVIFGFILFQSNAFLSKDKPVESEILIVEGWLPDYALEKVRQIFKKEHYKKIITTGGPLEVGSYLKEYKDYAHLAKASLISIGMKEEDVVAVATTDVKRDRTFHSALALKKWMIENNIHTKRMNLASLGPHTRRSQILFQKVFLSEADIGSIVIEAEDYDPKKWYASSAGVRTTINELIAYVYVLILQ